MGFNSAFKGLMVSALCSTAHQTFTKTSTLLYNNVTRERN